MFIVARASPPPTTPLQTARATPRHTTRRTDREIMAAAAAALLSHRFSGRPSFPPRPSDGFLIFFCPSYLRASFLHRRPGAAVCFVLKEVGTESEKNDDAAERPIEVRMSVAERTATKQAERRTYLVAAVMSTLAITSMAVAGVYYRFYWQMEGGEVPLSEAFGTFALSVGASVGMELWARWAHRALWHASLWPMHESHHRPRDGPFELNDVFAIVNAVPAISLLAYGFLNRGLLPGLCFGAGLGITLFGIAYMFVHDGLVHRRFPVGPIANVPYFRRVAAAHQIHHMDKFDGVPYGLFLGPKELEEVGGTEELEKEVARRTKY